jgi:hypothetical protein
MARQQRQQSESVPLSDRAGQGAGLGLDADTPEAVQRDHRWRAALTCRWFVAITRSTMARR